MGAYLILWFICGVVASLITRSRGRSEIGGFFLGALLGPLGIIVALVVPKDPSKLGYTECPYCAEYIKPNARVCKHCGRDL
ncbi:zinc ribbon domain-containing protein [Roseivirga sp.]|uniref:zinc ribbon domain-containing protein n=1 Tax=Roseivirga sp. TaxID=1964215 RepID=UPI003B52889A